MDILEKLDDLIQEILEDTFTGSKTELKKTNFLADDSKKKSKIFFVSPVFTSKYTCAAD